MATTNVLVWNPALANAESDAAYSADTMRQNGATAGTPFGSPLANKAFYQWSTVLAALATMMVNKGYTILDTNFSDLVTALSNIRTSADFPSSLITVPYSGSLTFSTAVSSGFEVTLTGDVSASTITGLTAGQQLTFVLIQDSTGGHAFTWPSPISSPAICQAPGSITLQRFEVLVGGTSVSPMGPPVWVTSSGIAFPTQAVMSISGNGTCISGYSSLVEKVNASGGSISRSLYSAVGYSGFQVVGIKADLSANVITYTPQSGQTIDGFASYSISKPYNAVTFVSDGANWWLI